ncbi:MAG: MBOAT family protein [Spirochaetaceae bacterium]|nr:MBOAT family protein [Spirochaetaceae bacterium]
MGFTEITFLFVFMPVSIVIYLVAEKIFHKDKINNLILVGLSLLFYFWASKETVAVFLLIVIFTYMAGWMVIPAIKRDKKLVFPVIVLVGTLAFYKYITIIAELINKLIKVNLISAWNLITPIGLSFVVFESVSYIVDIYRGDAEPGSFLECLTFLSLFPKVVSGPIVLWKDFKSQLSNRRTSGEYITKGIDKIIIGYAKKAIIADTFGSQILIINSGISGVGVDVPTMWLKALLYFFQIYFDFSGYSDIAIGLSNIFGFKIKENFNYPYLSTSVSEFWRRWHISLGSWFREYVYIPLGGNRKGNVYVHLAIVFSLTGVWHGTGWTFLVWAGVHGICVLTERVLRNKKWYKRAPYLLKWFFTIVVVFFAWILFSSISLKEAWQNYVNMFVPMTDGIVNFTWRYYLTNRTLLFLIIAVLGHFFGLERVACILKKILNTGTGIVIKRIALLLLFIVDVLYVVNSTYSPFIYFQF